MTGGAYSLSPVLGGEGGGEGLPSLRSKKRAPHPNPLPRVQGRGDKTRRPTDGLWLTTSVAAGRPCTSLRRRPRRRLLQVQKVERRPGQEPFVFFALLGREHLPRLLLGRGHPLPVARLEV